ncbi:hypothetical protein NDN08_004725 [Rhodosorus marinus]|uniref:Metallo-beta-lactamase domain-containing protein n=1 Tax=Rhodosorus marinus TaxID=101924 RepID=A0AAV8URA8_9RHOD|nr:hypothetical protein NDN08_004725 [Rhodosorus marinus]
MVIGVLTFKRISSGGGIQFRGRTRRYREIGEAAQLDEQLRRRRFDQSMPYKSGGRARDDRERGSLWIPQIGATLSGTSVSGIGTTIFVKEFGICFDAGRYHEGVEGARVYAITHGHSDHIGALHHILRVRGQNRAGSPTPTVVMPNCYKTNWMNLLKESTLLDAGPHGTPVELKQICSVHPIPYEEESDVNVPLAKGLRMKSLPMDHRVPTCAYVLMGSRRTVLEQYRNLPNKEIRRLVKAGEHVIEVTEEPVLGFTGDTTIDGIMKHESLLRARVLIMECTFMCDRTWKKAADTKHIHLEQLGQNADAFENEVIVLMHTSERYKYREASMRVMDLETRFPQLRGRLLLWKNP